MPVLDGLVGGGLEVPGEFPVGHAVVGLVDVQTSVGFHTAGVHTAGVHMDRVWSWEGLSVASCRFGWTLSGLVFRGCGGSRFVSSGFGGGGAT